jgi:hypothetical protein
MEKNHHLLRKMFISLKKYIFFSKSEVYKLIENEISEKKIYG